MIMYSHSVIDFCSYAFTLEETNERAKAEKLLERILDMNPKTPWAHHAMCKSILSTLQIVLF